jgi:hypothetical protein
MRKRSSKGQPPEILPEYDFGGKKGVRGKYYEAYRQGHSVRINKADGTVAVTYFSLEDGAVVLDPDVRKHFPSARSVNRALRKLIPVKQKQRKPNNRPT